ncbi:MAG: hypothetical protein COA49_04270 [Bacteroidetes bacterium]|nr:MAG: hypothetical protein COA49_04270 [Bacteroidota bacterium]
MKNIHKQDISFTKILMVFAIAFLTINSTGNTYSQCTLPTFNITAANTPGAVVFDLNQALISFPFDMSGMSNCSASIELQGYPCFHENILIEPTLNGCGILQWEIILSPDALPDSCCGVFSFPYFISYDGPIGIPEYCVGTINLTIECGENDCGIIDFTTPVNAGGVVECINVCENSTTVAFAPTFSGSGYTYNWVVGGGTIVSGQNTPEATIAWGPNGPGYLTVTITNSDPNFPSITHEICINILEGPTASFTSNSTACLDSPIQFTNTSSLNSTDFLWDFGDGQTSQLEDPSHNYTTPGTYTVTLTVSAPIYDNQGRVVCICSDSFTSTVVVSDLVGPDIFWISTLCENDTSSYWTNSDCTGYDWGVLDSNGNPLTFTGQGTSSIAVQWGLGPFGTVTLAVTGCTPAHCPDTISVQVPIIPANGTIGGNVVVCLGDVVNYNITKWVGVDYLWTATGGTILQQEGQVVTVQWNTLGTHTLDVTYSSPFLQNLPGHTPPDCSGSATLSVDVLPEFSLSPPYQQVCVGATSVFTITAPAGGGFIWNVPSSLSYNILGPYSIDITWPVGSGGTYNITAQPDAASSGLYCNSLETAIVQVVEITKPTGITGPIEVCSLTQQYLYEVAASTGMSVLWTPYAGTPGAGVPVAAPSTGSYTQVTWGNSGPYSLAASYVMDDAPFCVSDTVLLNITELVLDPLSQILPITTPCANTVSSYNLTSLHPDATVNWTVVPAQYGSVINGQGTDNIQIQWNDIPTASQSVTIIATAELCGNTLAYNLPLTLTKALEPIVVGTDFCQGNQGYVSVSNTISFTSYNWSPSFISSASYIQPSTPGEYIVNTIDVNGCASTGGAIISLLPSPIINLTTNGPTTLYDTPTGPSPSSTQIVAPTNPAYTYSWTLNGSAIASTSPTVTHNWYGSPLPATYTYTVTICDGTCCSTESITIYENPYIIPPPPGCTPQAYTLVPTATANPECDTWSFAYTSSNFTFVGWNFDDGTTTPPNPHVFSEIGYYNVTISGTVPSTTTGVCAVYETITVQVAMIAQYGVDITCTPANASPELCLNDETAYLPSTSVASTNFTIGGSTGTTNPFCSTSFSLGSSVNTQLIAVHSSGCTSTATQVVTIPGPVTISPVPDLCFEEAGAFNASCVGAVSFDWNFDDSTIGPVDALFNGASASHAYADNGLSGPYSLNVTVVATHVGGCEFSASTPVVVNGLPAKPTIISQDGDFMFCISGGVEILELSPVPSAGVTVSWWEESSPTVILGAGPTFSVSTVGTYGATITDIFTGCSVEVDPVDVQAWPPVPAGIAGTDILCTGDCAELVGPSGDFSYDWSSTSNPSLGSTSTITICSNTISSPETFTLNITDNVSLCSSVSTHIVTVAPTPVVSAGTWPLIPCEGQLVTLLVDPFDPGLNYIWSGGNPNPYVTSASGIYTVIGTDPLTGCKGTSTVEVYPCPNLCQVPTGCYTACDTGKTICAPLGLSSYQWNFNYVPIPGATSPCYTATIDGIYTLTATNGFGCPKTSDILDMTFTNCDSCQIAPSDITGLNLTSLGIVLQPIAQTGAIQNVACCLWSINPTLAAGSLLDPTLLCMDIFWGDGTSQLNMPFGSPLEHCYFDECTDYNISVKIFCCNNPDITVGINGIATCACVPDCYVRTSFWESVTPTADGLRCTVTFTSTDYLGPDMLSSQNPNWTIYDSNGLPILIPISGVTDLTIDLAPGTYTVCRSIEGVSLLDEICTFEHCHDIVVDCCIPVPFGCPDCAFLDVDIALVDLGSSFDAAGNACCEFGIAPHLITGCNIPESELCFDVDWGDGTTIFNLNFMSGYTHCYSNIGDYIVTVTVYCCSQGSADNGQFWTFTSPATCLNPNGGVCQLTDTGDFFYNETAPIACFVGCDASFLPQGIGPGLLVSWDFGDGTTSTPLPPGPVYHCYSSPCGTYVVTMTVECENDPTMFYYIQKTVVINCGGVDCWINPNQCPGDFDNDGFVGIHDLLDLLGAYGGSCF